MQLVSSLYRYLPLFLILCCMDQNFAQTYQPLDDADVHEAYVTKVTGNILIDAQQKAPPSPLRERIPEQTDSAAVWIEGYWAWSDTKQDYIWTSGIWRRPPPAHQWIKGFWKEYDDGWSWIPGFWSDKQLNALNYIEQAPPETVEEEIPSNAQNNQFWSPGFWWYSPDAKEYEWIDGHWEALDPNWVLIPSHYTWRPEGYVFIDAYWDWPIDSLGTAYAPVYIPQELRETATYEPSQVVEVTQVIEHYFYSYPDYTPFYHHHYHYHPHYWENYCCTPQWWSWDSWWGLSWSNQWGLWWWYSNPGYPAPQWISGKLSNRLDPSGSTLHRRMRKVRPPRFITPDGVASPRNLLKQTERVSGHRRPIFPQGQKEREKIWQGVDPKGNKEMRPEGTADSKEQLPPPPFPQTKRSVNERVQRAPQGQGPRTPRRPDQRSDVKEQPERQKPPRPDFNRDRRPERRPRPPRETAPSEPTKEAEQEAPRQNEKPKISYPPGFRERDPERSQRQERQQRRQSAPDRPNREPEQRKPQQRERAPRQLEQRGRQPEIRQQMRQNREMRQDGRRQRRNRS